MAHEGVVDACYSTELHDRVALSILQSRRLCVPLCGPHSLLYMANVVLVNLLEWAHGVAEAA